MSDVSTRPEAAKSAVDRLTFFSDAVVAIAITLLVIDLPVPESHDSAELFAFLADHQTEYYAFGISFLVIATYWRGHHRLYRYVTDAPPPLVTANLAWLFFIVLTPFANRVIFAGGSTFDSDFPVRFAFYATVTACLGLTMFAGDRVIDRLDLLDGAPAGLLRESQVRHLVVPAVFLASIPFSFVIGAWAFALWALNGLVLRGVDALLASHRVQEAG